MSAKNSVNFSRLIFNVVLAVALIVMVVFDSYGLVTLLTGWELGDKVSPEIIVIGSMGVVIATIVGLLHVFHGSEKFAGVIAGVIVPVIFSAVFTGTTASQLFDGIQIEFDKEMHEYKNHVFRIEDAISNARFDANEKAEKGIQSLLAEIDNLLLIEKEIKGETYTVGERTDNCKNFRAKFHNQCDLIEKNREKVERLKSEEYRASLASKIAAEAKGEGYPVKPEVGAIQLFVADNSIIVSIFIAMALIFSIRTLKNAAAFINKEEEIKRIEVKKEEMDRLNRRQDGMNKIANKQVDAGSFCKGIIDGWQDIPPRRQEAIIAAVNIKANGGDHLTGRLLASASGVSLHTANKAISEMMDAGFVVHNGKTGKMSKVLFSDNVAQLRKVR